VELLMRYLVFALALGLTACTTVPVTARFPDKPGELVSTACPNLEKLKDSPTLSDVSRTIANNYGAYYECAVKVDMWIRWYNEQRVIFEGVSK
jgi:hypothetical protein